MGLAIVKNIGRQLRLLLSVLVLLFFIPEGVGAIIHVSAERGNDQWSGQSWSAPVKTLEAALALSEAGDEIWLEGGIYSPPAGCAWELPHQLTIRGGFCGNETSLEERQLPTDGAPWELPYPTIFTDAAEWEESTPLLVSDYSCNLEGIEWAASPEIILNGGGAITRCHFPQGGNCTSAIGLHITNCGFGAVATPRKRLLTRQADRSTVAAPINLDDFTLLDQEFTYSGAPVALDYPPLPAGVRLILNYQVVSAAIHTDLSQQPPIYPGEYRVSATASDGTQRIHRSARITIHKAPLTCIARDIHRYAGEANPPLQCDYQGLVGSDTPESLRQLPQLYTTANHRSPATPDGYPIDVVAFTDHCYEITTVPGRLYVQQKQPRYHDAAATMGVYGDTLGEIWLTGYTTDPETDEFIPGEFIWEEPSLRLDAGNWECNWQFIPDDALRYNSITGSCAVTILPRPITIAIPQYTKSYGTADPNFVWRITSGSLVATDQLNAAIHRAEGELPGEYQLQPKECAIACCNRRGNDGAFGENYEVEIQPGLLSIVPMALTISAQDATKAMGAADPILTWSITQGQLAAGDSITGELEREAGEATGTYAITQGTLNLSSCYHLEFQPGTMTITPGQLGLMNDPTNGLPLTAGEDGDDPDDAPEEAPIQIVYGTLLCGEEQLDFTICNLANGEAVAGTLVWENEGQLLPAGDHELQWHFLPEDEENYLPLSGIASLEVLPARLTVTIEDASRQYGARNPAFTISTIGFVEDDSFWDYLSPELVAYCQADVTSPPGEYPIELQIYSPNPNYTVEWQPGILTILPAAPKPAKAVTVGANVEYGKSLSQLSLGGSFVAADGVTAIPGRLEWVEPEFIPTPNNCSAEWKFTPDDGDCYTVITGTTVLSIQPAKPTLVRLSSPTVFYGDVLESLANPADYRVVNPYTNEEVPGTLHFEPLTNQDRAAPGYAKLYYVFFPQDATLYESIHDAFEFQVHPRPLVIDLPQTTTYYNEPDPPFQAQIVSGAVEGDVFSFTYVTTPPTGGLGTGTVRTVCHLVTSTCSHGCTLEQLYTIQGGSSTYQILPRPIQVLAVNKSRKYNSTNYNSSIYSFSLVDMITSSTVNLRTSGELASQGSISTIDAGEYPITAGTLTLPTGYTIAQVTGTYTVTPITLTPTIDAASKSVFQPDPTFTISSKDATTAALIPTLAPPTIIRHDQSNIPGDYTLYLVDEDTGSPNYLWDTSVQGTLKIGADYVIVDDQLYNTVPPGETVQAVYHRNGYNQARTYNLTPGMNLVATLEDALAQIRSGGTIYLPTRGHFCQGDFWVVPRNCVFERISQTPNDKGKPILTAPVVLAPEVTTFNTIYVTFSPLIPTEMPALDASAAMVSMNHNHSTFIAPNGLAVGAYNDLTISYGVFNYSDIAIKFQAPAVTVLSPAPSISYCSFNVTTAVQNSGEDYWILYNENPLIHTTDVESTIIVGISTYNGNSISLYTIDQFREEMQSRIRNYGISTFKAGR